MFTQHEISIVEHLSYIKRLQHDDRQKVYVVLRDGKSVSGCVGLSNIDFFHKKVDWAFYLAEDARGGVGSALEFFVLDTVFTEMEMEKLNCEVLETNPSVVAMHKKFGFSEEGFRRSNIVRDGKRIGVHLLGITREEWGSVRGAKLSEASDKLRDIEIGIQHD